MQQHTDKDSGETKVQPPNTTSPIPMSSDDSEDFEDSNSFCCREHQHNHLTANSGKKHIIDVDGEEIIVEDDYNTEDDEHEAHPRDKQIALNEGAEDGDDSYDMEAILKHSSN
eukprot:CAMPEP_0176348280 /NCGR_PEP_ID=MMETSP0126-20121128/7733_1 /TAXON_ID=141414 ORGANISM="Strombidinopsis acuminatum, Strain SPMC142" /NCGR_SAMPLE_ID=MMETSP0126 /ASSEMBLY_ACC=CAM_ASM_000229 /LENGTH=112 /DNA_ID=CAMNT_0017696965 /DNA_START=131 /DNA_END=469 /DNA_ORIENTATION=-